MKILSFTLIALLFVCSCKENTKAEEVKQKAEISDINSPAKGLQTPKAPDVTAMNSQAEAILKYRNENNTKKWAIMDVGAWKYDGVFKAGKMLKPEEVEGKWIDFDQNGTYEYGLKSKIEGKGKYHYDNDKTILLLVDDNKSVKPQEYSVKLLNGFMIMEGNDTYQDQSFQAKLSKSDTRPQ